MPSLHDSNGLTVRGRLIRANAADQLRSRVQSYDRWRGLTANGKDVWAAWSEEAATRPAPRAGSLALDTLQHLRALLRWHGSQQGPSVWMGGRSKYPLRGSDLNY